MTEFTEVFLDRDTEVVDIYSEEYGTGILIRTEDDAIRLWGPPSALWHFVQRADRSLEATVNPAPRPTTRPALRWWGD